MPSIHHVLDTIEPTLPVLPITHVTSFRTLERLADGGTLGLNSRCPRFGRPATYLFYGAPFYKVPHRPPYELDIDDADEHPVGLLLPSSVMAGISAEVFPFDTGALMRNLYAPWLEAGSTDLREFARLSSDAPSDAAKLVHLLFGSNAAYVQGEGAHPDPNICAAAEPAGRVAALHRAKLPADVRRRAIEIVALQDVAWRVNGLVVIGPRRYLSKRRATLPQLGALLAQRDVTVLDYEEIYPFSPTSDSILVLQSALTWMKQQLLLEAAP